MMTYDYLYKLNIRIGLIVKIELNTIIFNTISVAQCCHGLITLKLQPVSIITDSDIRRNVSSCYNILEDQ